MSIRSNSLPRGNNISLQLQDVLRRNGMQAQVNTDGEKYMLSVQGHDSPQLTYNLTRNQYNALVDGGTNSSNKQAYKTFVSLVHADFDCPKDYVHARNANSKVTMGLHGYRVQDQGRTPMPVMEHGRPMGIPVHPVPHGLPMDRPHGRDMLGWTQRQQDGFHMRRRDGQLVMTGGPMIPERENGRMKPGELQSGAYGFYYKGSRQQSVQQDPLQQLQTVVKPVEYKQDPKKYRDLISSAVYFTNEKWQECLRSHGVEVDSANKKLTIRNANIPEGVSYDLTDQQVKELTSNSLKGDSVFHRIDVINGIIGKDFQDKLTFDQLNSTNPTNLRLTSEAEQRLHPQQTQTATVNANVQQGLDSRVQAMDNPNGVDGHALDETSKGWYRQINNGREVNVGNIWVDKDAQNEGKFKMSAVINGEVVSHEINEKQYNKFLALDDYHRLKLFDKVFDEVKMKTNPGEGMNFGQALLGGLAAAGQVARMGADIAHDVEHIKHPHSAPDVYAEEQHHHGRIYVKAGLDTPESIAARAFDAGMNAGFRDAALHR